MCCRKHLRWPENSHGEWLGIVNEATNGSADNNIVAVEFDTNKSYLEDVDDNHVGVDINSVYSIEQESLTSHGVNLSSASDVTATLQYNGTSKILVIYVFMGNTTADGRNSTPIISRLLNLPDYLPQQVYVGFSASTGEYAELNCIKSWSFNSTEIDDDDNVLWVLWIVIPIVLLVVVGISFLFYKWWSWKKRMKANDMENYMVERQIQSSATAPHRFQLKDLKRVTGNFDSKNELGRGKEATRWVCWFVSAAGGVVML